MTRKQAIEEIVQLTQRSKQEVTKAYDRSFASRPFADPFNPSKYDVREIVETLGGEKLPPFQGEVWKG